jgi:photosystem II stability/assembly factor-like uncharacterized protein
LSAGLRVRAAALSAALALPAAADLAFEDAPLAPLAASSLLLDVDRAGTRIVAVGERGHVLISDDTGRSWSQARVPTRSMLTAVRFVDDRLGFAVGHDAVILRSTDAGESWQRVHAAPEEERPLLDVWFADAHTGFAIGAYGYFLRTRDGGTNWSPEPLSEDDFHLNQVSDAGAGRMYIAAEAGLLYRSDDAGETWVELPSPYEGSFFGTLALGRDTLLAFGLRGHLFRSADAGQSWQVIETGTRSMLTDAVALGDDVVLVAGLGGTLLLSSDGGRSFEPRPLAQRQGLVALVGAAGGEVVIGVGDQGAIRLPALR